MKDYEWSDESMKKALMVASVASMIQQFNMRNLCILQELGYEVHVAANFKKGNTCSGEKIQALQQELEQKGIKWYQIDFDRNVMNIKADALAYRQMLQLVKKEKYDLLHCHSPIGGVIGRLVGHRCHVYTIYTAHGFHFYKGAPKKNWLLFYPIEKFLSRYTDQLVVINKEDYELAQRKFYMKKLDYVPGVGVKTEKKMISDEKRMQKREEFDIPEDAFLITSVAEFTPNKNQITVLRALEQMRKENICYLMCGIGEKKEELEQYVKEHNLSAKVRFAGFRSDVHEILQASDCFVLSSIREGLSVALMEAMAEGLPIVCGKIRGNVDLIEDDIGGYLVEPTKTEEYKVAFMKLLQKKKNNPDELERMGINNKTVIRKFGCEPVDVRMKEIYQVTFERKQSI